MMQTIHRTGIAVFILGMLIFTINIFTGSYTMNKENIEAFIVSKKLDTLGADEILIDQLNKHALINETKSQFEFSQKITLAINDYNKEFSESLIAADGISDEEKQLILDKVKNGIVYNAELVKELFGDHPKKIEILGQYTSWMYDKEVKDLKKFEKDLSSKTKEINSKLGGAQKLSANSSDLLEWMKFFNSGSAAKSKGLWFFLTFGLTILGSLMYILPTFKLYGPAGIKNNGIFQHTSTNRGWIGWIVFIYLVGFYIALYFVPHLLDNNILLVDPISKSLSGGAASQWFLYGFIYCVAMTLMAIRMYVKYRHNRYQIVRTTVVLFFQIAFAFLIPEIMVSLNMPYFDFKNAWPLDYDFLFDWNIQGLISQGKFGIFLLLWGLILTIIVVPIMVYYYGKRWYCSWVCGCGGLAETLGDPYRQLSSKKMIAWKIERYLIHSVLVFALLMTIATVYTFFHNNPEGYWLTKNHFLYIIIGASITVMLLIAFSKKTFTSLSNRNKIASYSVGGVIVILGLWALMTPKSPNIIFMDSNSVRSTYSLLIGSIFSGVIGTGFYPIFGNRTWCRFGCPLAAYMGLIQRFKSKFRITTNGGQCISCGNCSTYCEQGIDVRAYAQKGEDIIRASCVGCGVCSAVCPRGVLKLENSDAPKKIEDSPLIFENNMVVMNQNSLKL